MSLNTSKSSGLLTANTLLATGRNLLKGVLLPAGAGSPTITIYDNTAGSGKILFQAAGNGSTPVVVNFTHAVQAELGLYVVLGGTGPTAIVYFG
ncbi:MAG: hypothetical protein KGI54_14220 [Pseudomonadota bacterium]|nr:hypothetical protein [Pseudomonadota bacterium]